MKRLAWKTLISGSLLLPLSGLGASAEMQAPNIILISVDTVSANHLQSYGYKYPTTPFIDKFAKENVLFKESLAVGAYSLPSHFSIFTGVWPQTHHLETKPGFGARTANVLHRDILTITEYLKSAGYFTIWSAVMNHPMISLSGGLGRGFDRLLPSLLDREATENLSLVLQQAKKGKTFIFFHTYLAHDPYKPMPPYDEKFGPKFAKKPIQTFAEVHSLGKAGALKWRLQFNMSDPRDLENMRKLYDGGLRTVDSRLEELMLTLQKEKIYDNSIIILTSDHGELFGEHGLNFHSEPFRATLRVPLIIKAPGIKHRSVKETVFAVDIVPTILELAKIKGKPNIEGESLVPLLQGKKFSRKDPFSYTIGYQSEAVSDGKWKLILRPDSSSYLYNVKADPGELKDLQQKFPEEAKRLRMKLEAFRTSRLNTIAVDH